MPLLQTNAAKTIMNKINFPKEAILISGLYKISASAAIKFVLIIIVLSLMGEYPTSHLLLAPFVLAGIILFGYTIGLLATPLGMLYTDVGRIIPIGMQLLIYLSPVVYVIKEDNWISKIVDYNPFTALVVTGRSVFTHSPLFSSKLISCIAQNSVGRKLRSNLLLKSAPPKS